MTPAGSIRIEGLREAKEAVANLNPKRHRAVERAALKAGANLLAQAARRRAPVKSGRLIAEKIKVYMTTNKGRPRAIVAVGRIGAMAELGTKPHRIKAGASKTVAFVSKGRTRAFSTKGSGRKVLVTSGGKVLGSSVMHPGQPARPFLRPAVAETQDKIAQVYGDAYLRAALKQTALAAAEG